METHIKKLAEKLQDLQEEEAAEKVKFLIQPEYERGPLAKESPCLILQEFYRKFEIKSQKELGDFAKTYFEAGPDLEKSCENELRKKS